MHILERINNDFRRLQISSETSVLTYKVKFLQIKLKFKIESSIVQLKELLKSLSDLKKADCYQINLRE
jgi:hypothetical protein